MLLPIVPFSAPTFHCHQALESCPMLRPTLVLQRTVQGWLVPKQTLHERPSLRAESSWMQRQQASANAAELATQVTGRKSRRQRGDYLARTAALRQAMKGAEVTSGNDRYVSSSHRSTRTLSASTRTTERSYCSAAARPCKCNLFGAVLLRPS